MLCASRCSKRRFLSSERRSTRSITRRLTSHTSLLLSSTRESHRDSLLRMVMDSWSTLHLDALLTLVSSKMSRPILSMISFWFLNSRLRDVSCLPTSMSPTMTQPSRKMKLRSSPLTCATTITIGLAQLRCLLLVCMPTRSLSFSWTLNLPREPARRISTLQPGSLRVCTSCEQGWALVWVKPDSSNM